MELPLLLPLLVAEDLELQAHFGSDAPDRADATERGEVVDEMQGAAVQCVDCTHDKIASGSIRGASDRSREQLEG
jgi:hypothetical protein